MRSFILDDSVVELIVGAIARSVHSKTHRRGRAPSQDCLAATPSKEIVRQLIIDSFWASYMKEEERTIRFSLAFSDSSEAEGSFKFERPIPFDSNSVVKLCPALQHTRQIIGVTETKGGLEIWGFQTKLKLPFSIGDREDSLLIETIEPGRLSIRYNDPICILEGQETVFIDSEVVPRFLDEPWKGLYPIETRAGVIRARKDALLAIAQEVREIGHGGILIVVPEGFDLSDSKLEIPYSPEAEFDRAKRAFERVYCEPVKVKRGQPRWWAYTNPSAERQLLQQGFKEELRMIARLSSVDGAVVVSPEFDLLAFGAKINKRTTDRVQSIIISEPKKGTEQRRVPIGKWLRGTRHKSAAQFVMDQPGSIAFVVSQDGMISLMTAGHNKGEVLVYQHLEYLTALDKE